MKLWAGDGVCGIGWAKVLYRRRRTGSIRRGLTPGPCGAHGRGGDSGL